VIDWLPETPVVVSSACPVCRPDVDYIQEFSALWCAEHVPSLAGSADAMASPLIIDTYLSGHAEAGGVDNVNMCNLLHRPRTMDAACD
jgi:hypothetical protein